MNTIVNDEPVSFKELEKKIYCYVCELAREITRQMLESYDKELAEKRDKSCTGEKEGVLPRLKPFMER